MECAWTDLSPGFLKHALRSPDNDTRKLHCTYDFQAIFVLTTLRHLLYLRFSYLRCQGLDFEQTQTHIKSVFSTSRDHLLIQELSRLSMETSGICK